MHAKILFFVAVLALAALTLAGCSGGGGGSAQTPVAGVSRGVITKTGSVFVNGVEFDSKNATMIMDDPPVLGPGMVVTVKGVVFDDTHGKASSVEFADNLNGPIAAFNNLSSSMTVLGQKVKFVPGTTVFANFSGAGTIGVRPGEMVQVSGFTDPAGVIQATRIDRHLPDWAPSTIVELKGTISSRPSATTFTIGGLTVDFTGLSLPIGVDVGSSVQVMGTIQALTSTRLSATSITPIGDDFSDIDCAKNRTVVEGIVSNLAGNTFMVGSVPVISTVSLSGVANGVLVKVTGSLVNGFLIAKAITVETPTVPTTVPAAPSAVTAVGGVNQVTISWNAVAGATSYNIYWSTTTGVTTANGTKISNAISPYVQTGLTAGTTYFYVVTAVNAIGEGPPSSQVSAVPTSVPVAPPAPIGVSAVGSGATSATVSWAAVSGATSYNIYYATTAGVTIGGAGVTKLTGVTSPDTVTGLTAATTYFFIVTAVNSAGESVPSIAV